MQIRVDDSYVTAVAENQEGSEAGLENSLENYLK